MHYLYTEQVVDYVNGVYWSLVIPLLLQMIYFVKKSEIYTSESVKSFKTPMYVVVEVNT